MGKPPSKTGKIFSFCGNNVADEKEMTFHYFRTGTEK